MLWLWLSECCTAGDWGPVMMRGLPFSQRTNLLRNAQWPMKEWREDGCGTSFLWWKSTQEQSHFMLERYVDNIWNFFYYYCRSVFNLHWKVKRWKVCFQNRLNDKVLLCIFICLTLIWYQMQKLIGRGDFIYLRSLRIQHDMNKWCESAKESLTNLTQQ